MRTPPGRPRWWSLPLAIATILAWLPALLLTIAMVASDLTGCQVDEGSAHTCLVAGFDVGELLYTLAVSGWLMLVTLPFMAATAIAWAAFGLHAAIRLMARAGRGRA